MLKRLIDRMRAAVRAPQVTKTRIGNYVYWKDQYGRIIREDAE